MHSENLTNINAHVLFLPNELCISFLKIDRIVHYSRTFY